MGATQVLRANLALELPAPAAKTASATGFHFYVARPFAATDLTNL
jgi:hypothetical protein